MLNFSLPPDESQSDDYHQCISGNNVIHRYDMCNTEVDCVNEKEDEANCPPFNQGGDVLS